MRHFQSHIHSIHKAIHQNFYCLKEWQEPRSMSPFSRVSLGKLRSLLLSSSFGQQLMMLYGFCCRSQMRNRSKPCLRSATSSERLMKASLLAAGLAFQTALPIDGSLYPESYRSGFLSCAGSSWFRPLRSEQLRSKARTSCESLMRSKRSRCSYLLGTFWKQSLECEGSRWQRLPQRLEDWKVGLEKRGLRYSQVQGRGSTSMPIKLLSSPFIAALTTALLRLAAAQSKEECGRQRNHCIYYFTQQMIAHLLLVILLAATSASATATAPSVPQSFALLTVTHKRGNSYQQIEKFMGRYALFDCPIVAELNIVWNNEQPPEQTTLFNRQAQWKRPVYFLQTPFNSVVWRYTIPAESKAQVFFTIDDDITIDCEELTRGFKKWQENAIGNIAPIVTYEARSFSYSQQEGFKYGTVEKDGMFTLGLMGLSFASRHFMNLYNAKIPVLQEMRKIIGEKNNCEDIAMNWVSQYFYPELETIQIVAVRGGLLSDYPAIGLSRSSTHYPNRHDCIKQFTLIFGVNPLRYKPINDAFPHPQWRIRPLKESLVLQKQRYLEGLISGKQAEKGEGKEQSEVVSKLQDMLTILEEANSRLQSELQSKGWQLSVNKLLLFITFVLVILVIFLAYKAFSYLNLLNLSHNTSIAVAAVEAVEASTQEASDRRAF